MSFLSDILDLFSDSENLRRDREQIEEDWVQVRDDLSTFGASVVDFLDSIDGRNDVNSSFMSAMTELREQSRRRVEESRERIRQTHHRVRRSYQRQFDYDILRMQELMHQSVEELVAEDRVQNLEKVNWKQEGF